MNMIVRPSSDTTASAAVRLRPQTAASHAARSESSAGLVPWGCIGGGSATRRRSRDAGAGRGGRRDEQRGEQPARILLRNPRDDQHRRADQCRLVQRLPEPVQDGLDRARAAPDHSAVELLRHRRPRSRPGGAQSRGRLDPRRGGPRRQQLRQGPDRRCGLHDDSGSHAVGPRRDTCRRRPRRAARTFRRRRRRRWRCRFDVDQRSRSHPDADRQPLHGSARGGRRLFEEHRLRPGSAASSAAARPAVLARTRARRRARSSSRRSRTRTTRWSARCATTRRRRSEAASEPAAGSACRAAAPTPRAKSTPSATRSSR